MKKTAAWFLRVCISGLIAFCLLTLFCVLYYNVPVHYSTIDGATDYSWECNQFYSRATEGFAFGKTNNEGYLNTFDYSENTDIDILVMGSSHMEAYQVAMDESTAAILGSLFPDRTVYNIGISGHTLLDCADNLNAAVAKYKPSQYVLIETTNLSLNDQQLLSAINETVRDIPSRSGGLLGLLQKNQFLRLLYSQLKEFMKNSDQPKTSGSSEHDPAEINEAPQKASYGNEALYTELLAKLQNTVSGSGAQLIIVYHPHLRINEDGSASALSDRDTAAFFADICRKTQVLFLDMSDIFLSRYEEDHVLPYGFSNTSVGSGHLNRNGHAMIADAVYDLIKEEK